MFLDNWSKFSKDYDYAFGLENKHVYISFMVSQFFLDPWSKLLFFEGETSVPVL